MPIKHIVSKMTNNDKPQRIGTVQVWLYISGIKYSYHFFNTAVYFLIHTIHVFINLNALLNIHSIIKTLTLSCYQETYDGFPLKPDLFLTLIVSCNY